MTDYDAWTERNAAHIRDALADPKVRAELLALLGGHDDDRRRERRLETARQELEGRELRWRIEEEL
jgi:hypothetical protein